MKWFFVLVAIAIVTGLPTWADAASISNEDNEVHQIKGRKPGRDWVYIQINPRGTKYFNCRNGCELMLEKTGSSIQLDTDADVVIRNGVLAEK
jgi:hypothetical protein